MKTSWLRKQMCLLDGILLVYSIIIVGFEHIFGTEWKKAAYCLFELRFFIISYFSWI